MGALVWGALGGVPGLVAFRAVNTLDAQVGHKSARYLRYGWASARLDDVAGWPGARLTAALAVVAGGDPRGAVRAWRTDAAEHPSPNAGPVEAAFAGASATGWAEHSRTRPGRTPARAQRRRAARRHTGHRAGGAAVAPCRGARTGGGRRGAAGARCAATRRARWHTYRKGTRMSGSLGGGLLVAGTTSDAGKSVVTAGICRWLVRKGVKVAPFKAQNMSLNSFVTREGAEIGRAQAMQAQAARVEPTALMNPVLLKPGSDRSSQVVLLGKPVGEMSARGFFGGWGPAGKTLHEGHREALLGTVTDCLRELRGTYDAVICEGGQSGRDQSAAHRHREHGHRASRPLPGGRRRRHRPGWSLRFLLRYDRTARPGGPGAGGGLPGQQVPR